MREEIKNIIIREESYAKASETDYIMNELKHYSLKNDLVDFK